MTKWTYQNGHPYPSYNPTPNVSHRYSDPSGSHGVRQPTVTFSSLSDCHRDVTFGTPNDLKMTSNDLKMTSNDHLINSERLDSTGYTITDEYNDDEDDVGDEIINPYDSDIDDPSPSIVRGTYHIQKKRSSIAKSLAVTGESAIVDSEPELPAPTVPEPVIVRPRPGLGNPGPIRIVYGSRF